MTTETIIANTKQMIDEDVYKRQQVDWKYVLSASALAGVLSMLMSITGIPEVESEE